MTTRPEGDAVSTPQSAWYVYGIVPAGAAVPSYADVDAAGTETARREIELLGHGDIAAVVERIDPGRPLGKRADLVAHSAVLNAFAADGPVVPIRFGSVISQDSEVVDELLAPNHAHFAGLLEQLRGHAQFTLRARYVEEAILTEVVEEHPQIAALRAETRDQPEDVSYAARAHLGELVAQAVDAKRVADAEQVLAPVVPYSVDHRVTEGSGLDQVVDASFLVSDAQRAEFEDAAERVAEKMHGRATLKLLGPLAPFDFVREE